MNDKIFSVWNKSSKEMLELKLEETILLLDNENFIVRAPNSTDIEGNMIYEKDWIIILNKKSPSHIWVVENGSITDLRTREKIRCNEQWHTYLIVGNAFEQSVVLYTTLCKYNLKVMSEVSESKFYFELPTN